MKKNQRNYTVDLIRVIAAFGVIAIHVHADTMSAKTINAFFTPLCVPFFFTASLVYFVAGLNGSTAISILFKSFVRILIPFLAWTIVYTILLFAKAYLTHGSHQFVWWRTLFYGESGVQLYYLPDLFALQIITLGLYVLVNPIYLNKASALLLITAGIAFFWIGNYYACFGVAGDGILLKEAFLIFCGFLLSTVITETKVRFLYILAGTVLIVYSLTASLLNFHVTMLNYPVNITLGGLGVMLLAIGAPMQTLPKWIVRLSADSYGIYLSHVLFLEGFESVTGKIIHKAIRYDVLTKLIVVIGIFALSAIFTSLIRKIPVLRQVLLGEGNRYLGFINKDMKNTPQVFNSIRKS